MKKTLILLGMILGGAASAQTFQVSGAGSLTSAQFGGFFGVSVLNLTELAGAPIDVRLSGDLASGQAYVNGDVLVNFPVDAANLYAGLGASFAVNGVNAAPFFATATLGANYPITDQIGVFAEGALRYNFNTFNRSAIRAGVSYTF